MDALMRSEELRAKIIELVEEQTDTLEKQVFGRLTDSEMHDYEERQESIRKLQHKLVDLKRAS
jgi:hypothetical protein